jgi:hypothetical protein
MHRRGGKKGETSNARVRLRGLRSYGEKRGDFSKATDNGEATNDAKIAQMSVREHSLSLSLSVSRSLGTDEQQSPRKSSLRDKLDRWYWNDEMNCREEANKFALKRDVLAFPRRFLLGSNRATVTNVIFILAVMKLGR